MRFAPLALAAAAFSSASSAWAAPAPETLTSLDSLGADAPDFVIGNDTVGLARRQNYNQDYVTTGSVNFSPTGNGYSVSFSGAGDFVVGKGWSVGTNRAISFSGSTSKTAGTVLVSVYGWTRNPLIEYYITEYASDGKGSAQGTLVGTVTSDGSVYDVWKHIQKNQPSIVGTTTFTQYISMRRNARPGSGTVTTKNHFNGWAKLGLPLGTTFDYQVLATEGWNSAAGRSAYTISSS